MSRGSSEVSPYMTSWGTPVSFSYHPDGLSAMPLTPLSYREILIVPPCYPELEPNGLRPPRIDEGKAPPECYFLDHKLGVRGNSREYHSSDDRYSANPYRAKKFKPNRDSSEPWDVALEDLREKLNYFCLIDPWDPQVDFAKASEDLLELYGLAKLMVEFKSEFLMECPYPHYPQLLFRDAFQNIASGILFLYQAFYEEPTTEVRYCDDSVIIWLLEILSQILGEDVKSLEPCSFRWYQNVKLWILRNFSQDNFAKYKLALRHMNRIPLILAAPDTRPDISTLTARIRSLSVTSRCRREQVLGHVDKPTVRFRTSAPKFDYNVSSRPQPSHFTMPLSASEAVCEEPMDIEETTSSTTSQQRSSRNSQQRSILGVSTSTPTYDIK